eukprot:c22665_g1_i1 orf=2-451(-)
MIPFYCHETESQKAKSPSPGNFPKNVSKFLNRQANITKKDRSACNMNKKSKTATGSPKIRLATAEPCLRRLGAGLSISVVEQPPKANRRGFGQISFLSPPSLRTLLLNLPLSFISAKHSKVFSAAICCTASLFAQISSLDKIVATKLTRV